MPTSDEWMILKGEARYLDRPCASFGAFDGVWCYCRCGYNSHLLTPANAFKVWPRSSLKRIVAKMRCTKCGRLGDVPEIRTAVLNAPGEGRAHAGFQPRPAMGSNGGPPLEQERRGRPRRRLKSSFTKREPVIADPRLQVFWPQTLPSWRSDEDVKLGIELARRELH